MELWKDSAVVSDTPFVDAFEALAVSLYFCVVGSVFSL